VRRKASQGEREGEVCPSSNNILRNHWVRGRLGWARGYVREWTTSSAESYVDEVRTIAPFPRDDESFMRNSTPHIPDLSRILPSR
jgi:hypothetical protein